MQGVLVQDVMPTTAQRYDVSISEFEDYLRVRGTFIGSKKLSRDHRSWSFANRADFRTPVSHKIAPSVAVSAWPHNVPQLSL